MRVLRTTQEVFWPHRAEYHVLTYAEEGFAPLNIHTRESGVSKKQLVEFANRVNSRNETGSLHPLADLSAVPRALVREKRNSEALRQHIEDFFRANEQTIHAKKVLCDFRTPGVQRFVIIAIQAAALCPEAAVVEEITVIE